MLLLLLRLLLNGNGLFDPFLLLFVRSATTPSRFLFTRLNRK